MKATVKGENIEARITNCPRCEGNHRPRLFKKFQRPVSSGIIDLCGYWTMCPKTQEPVLLTILGEERIVES